MQSSSLAVPVGTIWPYTGDLNEIPDDWHLCDGTNGTPDLRNRFLEGTTTKANIFVEAGLPNLKGEYIPIPTTDGFRSSKGHIGIGVFYTTHYTASGYTTGIFAMNEGLGFDASRYSSIYRDDIMTVQPAAYTVYYIMRIK